MPRRKQIELLCAIILVSVLIGIGRSSQASFSLRPAALSAAGSAHNEATYNQVWKLISDNYCARDKLSKWRQWQHKFDGRMRNHAQLVQAISQMVDSLGDDYTYILDGNALSERTAEQNNHTAVVARKIGGNLGYVHIANFADSTVCDQVAEALQRLADVDGYVLDLRDNHGGYVDRARDVFAMFMPSGLFMSYDGYQDGDRDLEELVLHADGWYINRNGVTTVQMRRANYCGDKPLVVLVNHDTRSAAEMLAGALRAHRRAVVVGSRTFGKGVLQDTYEVEHGLAVKIVTARYFLPDGRSLHKRGLSPDIFVPDNQAEEQLARANVLLRASIAQARESVESAQTASHGSTGML